MESEVKQWEVIANSVLNEQRSDIRREAEKQIEQLRTKSQPYDLCHAILTQSSNEFLLYEAGRCLSNAVVNEWDLIFESSMVDGDQSRAHQLLKFILNWAEHCGNKVSAAARQRVLCVVGALVKRAAGAVAKRVVAAYTEMSPSDVRLRIKRRLEESVDPEAEQLARCDLLIRVLEHIESLTQSMIESNWQEMSTGEKQPVLHRCLLGLCILSAVLDEWSSPEGKRACLSLNARYLVEARFQNFELLRIYSLLLRLTHWVVHSFTDMVSLDPVENDLVFRLISSLDSVFSWKFLTNHIHPFDSFDGMKGNSTFHPSPRWNVVLESAPLYNSMVALIKLHMLVRNCSMLGSRTLMFFVCLTSTNFRLPDDLSSHKNPAFSYHLPVVYCLTRWLTNSTQSAQPIPSIQSSLMPGFNTALQSAANSLYLTLDDPACPKLCTNHLEPYELSILADMLQPIWLTFNNLWYLVDLALLQLHPCTEESGPALVLLITIERFLDLLAGLLSQGFYLASITTADQDDDSERSIQEAVELLCSTWLQQKDMLPDVLKSELNEVNHAESLTTHHNGSPENTPSLQQLVHILALRMVHHRREVFRSYLLSKLAPPDGSRLPGKEDNTIDFELDTEDVEAYENSLYTASSCAMSAPQEAASMLLHLLNDRMARLTRLHSEGTNSDALELFEDLHWILLITGHFLVAGPSSLSGLPKIKSWCRDFAIPAQLCDLPPGYTVNVQACNQLILSVTQSYSTAQDLWPSVDGLASVPVVVQICASLLRLLRIQAEHRMGSAQLLEDNLWVMARIAVAYCHLLVRDDPCLSNIESSHSLLSVFHPGGRPMGPTTPHSPVVRSCLQAMLSCACVVINKWREESKVVSSAINLIHIVARYARNASIYLSSPVWCELCALLGDSTSSLNLPLESLTQLVDSCLCGTYLIDKERLDKPKEISTVSSADPLVLQLLHSFRQRLSIVSERFTTPNTITSKEVDGLTESMAIVCGLVRFSGFAMAKYSTALDLVSFIWTALLHPTLQGSVNSLILNYPQYPEITRSVLSVFSEVAVSCFIYLANLPLTELEPNVSSSGDHISSSQQYHVKGAFTSAAFLNLTLSLYRNFAKVHAGQSLSTYMTEDDMIYQLTALLSILHHLADDEFELRLTPSPKVTDDHPADGHANAPIAIRSVDVIAVCLGYLLPLITEHTLMVPEICQLFYTVLCTACELRLQSLALLDDCLLVRLGQIFRLGIFGSISTVPVRRSVGHGCSGDGSAALRSLEVFKMVANHCLDARSTLNHDQLAMEEVKRLSTAFGLDMQLLIDLFDLVVKDTFDQNLESALALAILGLIHMNPDGYAQLVHHWLSSSQDPAVQARLQSAFELLGCDQDRAIQSLPPDVRFIASFTNKKPTAKEKKEFQRRFHQFAMDVRALICHT